MNKKTTSSDRRSTLSTFFSEMSAGGNALLDAKGEIAITKSLRESEEQLWQECLSHLPLVSAASEFIDSHLDEKKKVPFKSLRSVATRQRNKPCPKNQSSLKRAAKKAAIKLRENDPDQEVLSLYLTHLGNLVNSPDKDSTAVHHQGDSKELAAHYGELLKLRAVALAIRNRFVSSNLGLVVSVAQRYQFSNMPLSDLIAEGNFGLLKAVSRFDERRGFRFSTYATWWIRHAVGRSVSDKSRTVRIPVHVTETHQKVKRVTSELSAKLGRQPTRPEIAKTMDMSVSKLDRTIRTSQGHSLSLDSPIGTDGDRARMEVFSQPNASSAFDKLSAVALNNRAALALNTLAPLEIEILNRRFGLAGKTATTLQEIANTVGKSRERIRQIQEKALLKLREHLIAEHAV
ncbi:MAG: sigma-70 family RNA polymerase sigma factor [Kofleriaceae bacterium]|nr:sigma-70 family RNA polymerase sigma factor [Kofleriaceae bacterium]